MPSKSIPRGSRSPSESATIQYFCKIFTHDGIIVVVKVLSILFNPDRETSHYKWYVIIFILEVNLMLSRTTLMHGNILSHICFQDGEQIIAGICVKVESTQVK